MKSEDDMRALLGKRISKVVFNRGPEGQTPKDQVFLQFDDDTCTEMYSYGNITVTFRHGGDIESYARVFPESETFVFGE